MKSLSLRMKILSIFLVGIFLIIVSACDDKIEPPFNLGSDPINALNFGFTAQDGEWFYYINSDHLIERTNGKEFEIYENSYGRGMNLYGDYIYFLPFRENDGIYRVNKDNPCQMEQIVAGSHISHLIVVNDYLYYSKFGDEKSGVYRATLEGKKEKQLLEATINNMQFYDGFFYVAITADGDVLKMSPKGKEIGKLETEDGMPITTTEFMIYKDWVYFANRNEDFDFRYMNEHSKELSNLYRMRLDGTELEHLTQGSPVFVDEGPNLYYIYKDIEKDENYLLRRNVATGEETILYKGSQYFPWANKIGSDLYFLHWENYPNGNPSIHALKQNSNQLEIYIE